MPAGPETARGRSTARPPTIAIVGNDALLAARPASAVQLTHGLMRLGFDAVVPASWGDELVASACVERCAGRGATPAVLCSCPLVADRLLASGADLSPFLVALVPPAVAVARYLRALASGPRPHIVFLGACPGAIAEEIDERLTPDETLERLAEERIVLGEMPAVFESVIPADRRRTLSLPGGAPTGEALRRGEPPRVLMELESLDLAAELAQHLLSGDTVLIDPAPRLGCACSGAGVGGVPGRAGRAAVMAMEPPRSSTSAVDVMAALALDATVEVRAAPIATVPAEVDEEEPGEPPAPPELAPLVRQRPTTPPRPHAPLPPGKPEPRSGGRLRSPAIGVPRFQGGSPPVSRTGEGRALPRAYVAHRRTPPNSRRVTVVEPPLPPAPREAPLPPREERAPQVPRPEMPAQRPDARIASAPEVPPASEGRREPPTSSERDAQSVRRAEVNAALDASSVPEPTDRDAARPLEAGDERRRASRPEGSLAWLIREGPEAARVVPRYVPDAKPRSRRATIGIVGTALLAVLVVAVAWPRTDGASADGAVVPADSAAGTIVEMEPAATAATPTRPLPLRATPPRAPERAAPRRAEPARRTSRDATPAAPSARGSAPSPTAAASAATPALAAPTQAAPPAVRESTATPAPVVEPPVRDSAASVRAAELAEIRRELDRRQARIDSIARSVESLPARPRPPVTTP